MKTLRGWIPTGILMAVLLFGTSFANATITIAELNGGKGTTEPCIVKVDSGVVYGFTGVVYGFTGVVYGLTGVVYGFLSTPPAECVK